MSASATSPQSMKPLSILVVENHADTSKYLCMYLQMMGHAVRAAFNLREALKELAAGPCDVLISDIGLPDGTGWQLLREAHLPATVYAIAMSGFGMGLDASRSKDAGFRHHLLKPFTPDQLDDYLAEAQEERKNAA